MLKLDTNERRESLHAGCILQQQVSVIVPIYNEEDAIKGTINQLLYVLRQCRIDFEIIAVDDGSTDGTDEVLATDEEIVHLRHRRNRGYGAAIKTGLRHAKYETIVIIDADGTYPINMIPILLKRMEENQNDMVVGNRTGQNVEYPFMRKIPKFVISRVANYIVGRSIPDINSGLRVFKRDIAIDYFHLYPNGFSFTTTLTMAMACGDYEIEYVPVGYSKRSGKSKIDPVRDTINFFGLLLRISMYFRPFKFFGPIIWVFFLLSLGVLYRDVFVNRDLTQSSILFPLGTVLFFSLGLLADLIIRRPR